MTVDEFWDVIESVHDASGGDMDKKCGLLKNKLTLLGEKDLTDYVHHFDSMDVKAYTWPLWGAAYVMLGGCSDDSFSDFRATLISYGKDVFEKALTNPDSLANLEIRDEEEICYEGFQYVQIDVAEEQYGDIAESTVAFPDDPIGEEWEEEQLESTYPLLAKKYEW